MRWASRAMTGRWQDLQLFFSFHTPHWFFIVDSIILFGSISLWLFIWMFSGMEVASYLIDKALSITVIGSSEMPYQNTLGPEIGKVTMMVRNGGSPMLCPHSSTGCCSNSFAPADAVREKCEILHERQCDGGQRCEWKGGVRRCILFCLCFITHNSEHKHFWFLLSLVSLCPPFQ